MNVSARFAESSVTRWAVLVVTPALVLVMGQLLGKAGPAQLVALVLVWILAAILVAWGNRQSARIRQMETELAASRVELEDAQGQVRENARNDSLTGVANQRFLYEILRQEWGRAERTGSPLSMVITEFDGFETYSDSLGDHAGDRLLRQAAEIIAREVKRPGDLLARLGGKRFVVLLPDTDLEGANLIAERLRRSEDIAALGAGAQEITLSAGVAVRMPSSQKNEAELLEMARVCLAAAKRAGGNRTITQEQLV